MGNYFYIVDNGVTIGEFSVGDDLNLEDCYTDLHKVVNHARSRHNRTGGLTSVYMVGIGEDARIWDWKDGYSDFATKYFGVE